LSIVLEFLNKITKISVEKTGRNLDKELHTMVKYIGKLNIAMIGKSTACKVHQRVGVTGWKPGQEWRGKVRP
jgi:hypothetical protein